MYVVHFRAEHKIMKMAANQQFKEKHASNVYARIYQLVEWNKMKVVEAQDIDIDERIYVRMENRSWIIWLYAIKVENGKDAWIDKILKRIGLKSR